MGNSTKDYIEIKVRIRADSPINEKVMRYHLARGSNSGVPKSCLIDGYLRHIEANPISEDILAAVELPTKENPKAIKPRPKKQQDTETLLVQSDIVQTEKPPASKQAVKEEKPPATNPSATFTVSLDALG